MPTPEAGLAAYPHLFEPITVGTMRLRNRVMLPPHASAIGNIYGTDEDAERNIAYFEERVRDERRRVGREPVDPPAQHRHPRVRPDRGRRRDDRASSGCRSSSNASRRFSDALHGHGATVSVQMVHQGGMPHGASAVMSAPVINLMPHVMDQDDIDAFVARVRRLGAAVAGGPRGRRRGPPQPRRHPRVVPLPVHQPAHRPLRRVAGEPLPLRGGDAAGDPRRGRLGPRRSASGSTSARRCPGGYDVAGGVEIAQYLESTGLIDYVHGVVGIAVGQPQLHPAAPTSTRRSGPPWPASSRPRSRSRWSTPAGSTAPTSPSGCWPPATPTSSGWRGRTSPRAGSCQKAREGRVAEIRPCVGGNECISRRYVEGLGFACAVNPRTSHEVEGPWPAVSGARSLLVVGGGPAGMELAALTRESGFDVDALGGRGRARRAAAVRRRWRPDTRCMRPTWTGRDGGCATSGST